MARPPRVVITRRMHPAASNFLRAAGCDVQVLEQDGPASSKAIADECREADALLSQLTDRIDATLLTSAPGLRVVANYAVGHDNLDKEAATAAGVALANTPDVLTDATADLAWALLMAAARRLGEAERFLRAGKWKQWEPLLLLGQPVAGQTLGIVGAGRIGTAVARRAAGFKMSVLYTKPSGASPEMEALGARRVELEELLRRSDFVSLHAPLNPATRHLIGAPELALMKPGSVLVNTGRGPLIDEAALAAALATGGPPAAAGLDVFESEPQVHPGLVNLENVVLIPHLGSATETARAQMGEVAAANIVDALRGLVPRNCLNPDFLAHRRPELKVPLLGESSHA